MAAEAVMDPFSLVLGIIDKALGIVEDSARDVLADWRDRNLSGSERVAFVTTTYRKVWAGEPDPWMLPEILARRSPGTGEPFVAADSLLLVIIETRYAPSAWLAATVRDSYLAGVSRPPSESEAAWWTSRDSLLRQGDWDGFARAIAAREEVVARVASTGVGSGREPTDADRVAAAELLAQGATEEEATAEISRGRGGPPPAIRLMPTGFAAIRRTTSGSRVSERGEAGLAVRGDKPKATRSGEAPPSPLALFLVAGGTVAAAALLSGRSGGRSGGRRAAPAMAGASSPPRLPAWAPWALAGAAGALLLSSRETRRGVAVATDMALRALFPLTIPEHGRRYAGAMLQVSDETGVSPYTIAAIMSRESDYGRALSSGDNTGTGDNGNGLGLMQIDRRYHRAFAARTLPSGEPAWTDPVENIRYAVQDVLKPALGFFGSRSATIANVAQGGRVFVTRVFLDKVKAGSPPSGAVPVREGVWSVPDPRPLSGDALLVAALAAYNAGPANVVRALALGLSPDVVTTGSQRSRGRGDYGSDVLRRLASLEEAAGNLAATA